VPVSGWDGVTLTVEVALSAATSTYGLWDLGLWDTATWGPDVVWTDVSAYVRRVTTGRGFSRGVQTWQAGTAEIDLGNRDGRFSAANTSGPYASGGITAIRPLRPVRITAAYAGVTYAVYRGYVLEWRESWSGGATGQGDALTTLNCADEFNRLQAVDGLAAGATGAGEYSGYRVHRWLDAAGHAGDRNVDLGENTLQATTLEENTLTGLLQVAEAEGGALYVAADGAVVFESRLALIQNTRSITSQATFADDATGLPYASAEVAYDSDLVVTWAAYQREGGTVQSAFDATSRALYGDRRDTKTDLICETDGQALALAQWRVQQYKDPQVRFTAVAITPRKTPATLWPQALGRQVRDQITIVRNPPGGFEITQPCHIAGIGHQITREGAWTTTFALWSASPYVAYANSLWDVGLWDTALWFF
jgi:hypothetical protein